MKKSDPDGLEKACDFAFFRGVDAALIAEARERVKMIRAEIKLQEAMKTRDPHSLEKACDLAKARGVDGALIAEARERVALLRAKTRDVSPHLLGPR